MARRWGSIAGMNAAAYEGLVVLNYRLLRELGKGGFGVVYLAEHTELGRRAACKILYPEFVRRQELVERFTNEAKAVCAIGHRAIIDIHNFGRLESGEPYYLMEYFAGHDLARHVREFGPLSFADAVSVFEPVALALTAAHQANVIHRDLKPENIMVRHDGRVIAEVKLLDFGIAKLLDMSNSSQSRTGVAMGTPTYMAPEQACDAKNVDERADVYGFAATAYFALTGQRPFRGDSYPQLLVAVQTQMPPPLGQLLPSAPAALQDAVARCMAKNPQHRPASMTDAWAQIHSAMTTEAPPDRAKASSSSLPIGDRVGSGWGSPQHTPLLDTPQPPIPREGQTTLASAGAEMSHTRSQRRRRSGLWIAVGAGLAVAVVVVALLPPAQGPQGLESDAAAGRPALAIVDSAPGQALDASWSADAAPDRMAGRTHGPLGDKTASHSSPGHPADQGADNRGVGDDGQMPRAATPDGDRVRPRRRLHCSRSSFRRVYRAKAPDSGSVERALERLAKCRKAGKVDRSFYKRAQKALVHKLL
ncbi:MAG: serine/threonine protein kinase [Proteobacteria bacterium]|nr:serine/threonine protein kinase [Pseudomonadota bacterium]